MSIASTVRTEKSKSDLPTEKLKRDLLTEAIQSKLGNPERSSDIDLHAATNQVLKDVGMSTADSGGKLIPPLARRLVVFGGAIADQHRGYRLTQLPACGRVFSTDEPAGAP